MVKEKRISKTSRRQNDFYDFLCEYLEVNGQVDPNDNEFKDYSLVI